MRLKAIDACAVAIPFNVAFAHAAAVRETTQSLWVCACADDGTTGFGEGTPREYVTAESLVTARSFVSSHVRDWLDAIDGAEAMKRWSDVHRREIDANPAAWTAVELALLDAFGKATGKSVEALLGVPELEGSFQYTAVLGDAPPRQFEAQLAHYLGAGFCDFKIKLSGDAARDRAKVQALAAAGVPPRNVRADANNLWRNADAAARALEALAFPFFAIEEPLQAGDYDGMRRLAASMDTRIILDESLLRAAQLDPFGDLADRWIVNLRVSKMGGLVRSLEVVEHARRLGLSVIVGAHVGETSLLTRAALAVAHSARDLLVAQEGAFGTHLLSRDVVDPPLMFGRGGILAIDESRLVPGAGFGLDIVLPVPHAVALAGPMA